MANLPTTGITTNMVAQAIGHASNDVGILCSSGNVNKWSKWKPIRNSTVSGINDNILQNANYGLSAYEVNGIVTHNKATGISGTIIDSTYAWDYAKPRGGSYNEPFRLGDFRSYNHTAAKAIQDVNDIIVTDRDVGRYLNDNIDLKWYPSFKFGEGSYESVGAAVGAEIHLYMLEIIAGSQMNDGNWRIGLAIWHPTEKLYYIASSKIPLQSGLTGATVQNVFVSLFQESTYVRNLLRNSLEGDEFNVIPFLGYKLNKNESINEFYFEPSQGRAFNFTEGERIKIIRQGYERDIYTSFTFLATEGDNGAFGVGVNMTAPLGGIMGSLMKKTSPPQRIKLEFNSSRGTYLNPSDAGTKIMFRKGGLNEWIDIRIDTINGSTSMQQLSTSSVNEVIGSSHELQSYISSLPIYSGTELIHGNIRLLNDYVIIGEQEITYIVIQ